MKDFYENATGICIAAAILLCCYIASVKLRETSNPAAPLPDLNAPKPTFLYVRSARCIFCDRMEKQTFADTNVQAKLASYNIVKDSSRDIAKKYRVSAYPTYIVLASDGVEKRRGSGYRSPDEFLAWLDGANIWPDTGAFTPLETIP